MTGRLSKNFHGVGIGPLSKILAVKKKKPERVFGLWVRCRELDIFKILEIFRKIIWNLFGFWGEFFGRIFWEIIFGRNFLGVREQAPSHLKSPKRFFNLINNFSIFRVKKTNAEQLIWPKNQTPERKSWYPVNSTNPIRNVMFVLRNEKSAWNWTLRKWLSKLWRRKSWKVHYPWWLQMLKLTEKVHLFTLL